MESSPPSRQIRISRVGGRHLVFDLDDVVHIRRYHSTCAILTGTLPQAPTQNIFLGLPIELYAEEARLLIDRGAAYIADDAAEHLSQLQAMERPALNSKEPPLDNPVRTAYLQSLKAQRKAAQQVFEDAKAKVRAQHQHKRKPKAEPEPAAEGDESTMFGSPPVKPEPVIKTVPPAVTPTTSSSLTAAEASLCTTLTPSYDPLHAYLNEKGYYITPGLRFGGDYSVYPGDPFRYHAHYMANSYEWDQKIPMLDLVTSGRLGTAVKKSFLFGAKKPSGEEKSSQDAAADVRVFCIEWAGM
ncbi:hypothetical protein OQA88_2786 [Cercophora sp. LCS_1]